MGLLTTLSTLVGTSFTTGVRRLKRGPLRPGWSFKYEATVAFLKATNERIIHLDAPTQRQEMESLSLPSPALERVKREQVVAGGVPAGWLPSTPSPRPWRTPSPRTAGCCPPG